MLSSEMFCQVRRRSSEGESLGETRDLISRQESTLYGRKCRPTFNRLRDNLCDNGKSELICVGCSITKTQPYRSNNKQTAELGRLLIRITAADILIRRADFAHQRGLISKLITLAVLVHLNLHCNQPTSLIRHSASAQQMVQKELSPSSNSRLELGEYPTLLRSATNGSERQDLLIRRANATSVPNWQLERKNFGKRIQSNNGTNFLLARTIRHLNALNSSLIINPNSSDGSYPRIEWGSQPRVTKRDFISNLFKYRLPKSGSLLESWANLTNRHLNVSHSIGVSGDSDSLADSSDLIITPAQHSEWSELAQESRSIGTLMKANKRHYLNGTRDQLDYQVVAPASSRANVVMSNQTDVQPDWQASDIAQVIEAKKQDKGSLLGSQSELKKGAGEKKSFGEQLKGHEDVGNWKKEKHGEQQVAGDGKKDAKEGNKFIKDLGHNKHGWKNVYHKEEYAQHHKFHDVFRDKDWNNKKAKVNEDYRFLKANKFNDSQAKSYMDKDRHGTKYDYSKGNEWKRYEEDQFENGADDAQKEADKKDEQFDGHRQHHQQPASDSSHAHVQQDEQPEERSSADEAVIEQMKNKLEQLSGSGQNAYAMSPSSNEESIANPVNNSDGSESDYDSDWQNEESNESPSSHLSVNDIVKTAKRTNSKQHQLVRASSKLGLDSKPRQRDPFLGANSSSLEADRDDDDNENEGEQVEKPMAKQENRKNELRLKLELDLGKSVANERNSKVRRTNLTNPMALDEKSSSSGWRNSNSTKQRHQNSSSGWRPKEANPTGKGERQSSGGRLDDISVVQAAGGQAGQQVREPANSARAQVGRAPVGAQVNYEPAANVHKTSSSNASSNPARPISNLAQVLPSRPIFVKHLQMNGGILLGKMSGVSANNRTIPFESQLRPAPMMMGEDLTVDTSLSNPFGDLLSLPGASNQFAPYNAQASDHSPGREYMLLFGDHSAASEAQSQLIEGEPNVIFEAGSSTLDEDRQPYLADAYQQQQQQQIREPQDIEALMSQEQQQFAFLGSPSQYSLNGRPPIQVHQQLQHQHLQTTRHPLMSERGLSNLLRLASLNYTNALMNYGPAIGGSLVNPSRHHGFGRLLRLPRVFNSRPAANLQSQESAPALSFSKWTPFVKSLASMSRPKAQPQVSGQYQVRAPQQSQFQEFNDLMEAASKVVSSSQMHPMVMPAPPQLKPQASHQAHATLRDAPTFNLSSSTPNPAANEKKKTLRTRKKKKKRPAQVLDQEQQSRIKTKSKPLRFESNFTNKDSSAQVALGLDNYPEQSDLGQQLNWYSAQSHQAANELFDSSFESLPNQVKPPQDSISKQTRQPQHQPQAQIKSSAISAQQFSTKVPNFGERILKSFKDKLNIARG